MRESYFTVKGFGAAELIEKKSRFIASVMPVTSEEEVIGFLECTRKKYRDASHNVYAYEILGEAVISRYSDDKEPAGTAGLPILNLLRSNKVQNAIIIVTRYFGGTLLGAGGLLRAYSACAKEGLLNAGITECVLHETIHIKTDYGISSKIEQELKKSGRTVKDVIYLENVEFIVLVEAPAAEGFILHFNDISNGTAEITKGERVYVG